MEGELEPDNRPSEDEIAHPSIAPSTISNGETLILSEDINGPNNGDVLISSATDPSKIVYQVTSHISINRRKPKLVLSHDGKPIAHVFHHWMTGYKIGVDRQGSGDESRMQWVEMKREGLTALNKSYSFEWNGRMYILARMRGENRHVGGTTELKKGWRDYKVIEKDGDPVATFTANASDRDK
ncbi:uncharacterized protein N7483_008967 [Penicillium malachiteum]|uniref:uncharacterized protein n=1 Tax=Penicillium malachiteum TaxID=1324776 RepID=UPI002548EDA2|nr:uncharacterized protein N7483_008967 [Penicillium malachiteum]KAJ5721033.1 hypothetical protein N7483_008967 [Penicillium malachiteum]